MLRALRDGAKTGWLKYILLGFLVLAAGGLVLTDVGGFFRGGISSNVVAKGKGIEISIVEFDRTVRRVLARQGMAPQEAYRLGLINQILNGEVQMRILSREAHKLGIHVNDDTVTRQISKLAEPLATAETSKSEALKQVLRSQGVSEGEFVHAIRQEMGNTLFRNTLLGGASSVSNAQAQDLYQYQNEKRDFTGFILSNNGVKDIKQPTDENLQKYYDANKIDFLISEKRGVTIATLKKEMLADGVTITDDELRNIYDRNIDSYKRQEQRKIGQAILSTQNDAQDIFDKVQKGKSLKKAVKDVTGKTAAYIGENDFEKNGLLEEIAQPVFNAKTGETIGPIQTALGWHVLTLKEIMAPQTDSFEKAKKGIKDRLLEERLLDDLIETANTLDDQLAGGEDLETVVKEIGLTTEAFKNFNQSGINDQGKDLFAAYQGDKAQILEAAFDFNIGESAPVMELADGRYITVRVDNIQERSFTPFDTVRAKLKTRWINEQKALTNKARAETALLELKNDASLKDIAAKNGAKIRKFTLSRTGDVKAPLTSAAQYDIFKAQKEAPLQLPIEAAILLGHVSNISLPDTKKAEKEIEKISENLSDSAPQEILSQYISALSAKYRVKINERVLQSVYGTPAEN